MAATLPQGEEKAPAVGAMFDAIAPRYDLVNRVMTFGLDVRWRRRAVRALDLGPAATVVDLACGTGGLCRALARGGAPRGRGPPPAGSASPCRRGCPAPPGPTPRWCRPTGCASRSVTATSTGPSA